MRIGSLVLLVCTLVLWAPTAAAQSAPTAPTTEDCLACHSIQASRARTGRRSWSTLTRSASPFTVAWRASTATPISPRPNCHTPKSSRKCRARPAMTNLWRRSPRAFIRRRTTARRRTARRASSATACTTFVRRYALNLPRTCATCHGGQHLFGPKGEVADSYEDSVHGRAIARSGLLVSANCSSCHGSHDIRRKSDAASPVHRTNIAMTCARCHEGIQKEYATSVHAEQVAHGNTGAAVCSDCTRRTAFSGTRPKRGALA